MNETKDKCSWEYPSGNCVQPRTKDSIFCIIHKVMGTDLVNPVQFTATETLLKQRGSVYGDVRNNMMCSDELQMTLLNWFNECQKQDVFKSELDRRGWFGCVQMICHKLARMVTGDVTYEDNYKDICGYTELARKIVKEEPTV